jgi:dolichol-phosphate mannosyltransferase
LRTIIILPTYNEAENLRKLVSALFVLPLDLNLLIVDDNSPDGTGQIADDLAVEYPTLVSVLHRSGKLGLRTAYLEGIRSAMDAGAEAIAQMDADFSHEPARLVDMTTALENGADVALGSRYVAGGSVDEQWPIWRKWLSAFGNFYARSILGFHLRDVTTGYRLWKVETLRGMPLERIQSNGYIFLVEMAYMAYSLKYKFAQVPIYFADRKLGKSKMSLRIQLEAAFRVWQVRWNYRDLRKRGQAARVIKM